MSDEGVVGRHADHRLLRNLAVAAIVAVASVLFSRAVGTVPTMPAFWLPGAVVLAVLVIVAARRVPVFLGVLSVACVAANLAIGAPVGQTLGSAAVDAAVALVAALLVRRDPEWVAGRTERPASWLWFTVVAVAGPFAAGAVLQVAVRGLLRGGPPVWERAGTVALAYLAANIVAAWLIVPAVLRLRPSSARRRPARGRPVELAGTVALLAALTAVLMQQEQPLLLFLLPIPLVVAAVRHGALGAVLGSLVVVPLVIASTGAGRGPFVAAAAGGVPVALLWAHLFLALLMAAGYAVLAALDGLGHGAAPPAGAHRITVAGEQVWVVATVVHADGRVEHLDPGEERWREQVHPPDLGRVRRALASALRGRTVTLLIRARYADDTWRWFDVHVHRDVAAGCDAPVVVFARDATDARLRQLRLEVTNLELREAVGTDALTGLANRRGLAAAQERAWAAAAAADAPLSVLVADVDHFKAFNDSYGHVRGDEALTAVAQAIRGALRRPADVAARYGGEEFVVLLPNTDEAGAVRVAEKIRRTVRDRGIDHERSASGAVTVSIGVATGRPGRDGTDDGSLLAAADAALYRAKQHGRDRVELVDP